MVKFTIGEGKFKGVFMVSPQRTNDIIACEFLKEYAVIIDFERESLIYVMESCIKEHAFR